MILVDSRIGSVELVPHIRKIGVPCEPAQLEYGDACFEGNGDKGRITLGLERKTLSDLLNCIDSSRYVAHQRPGMLAMYDKSFLILEGMWRPNEHGILMEGFNGGGGWKECRYRTQRVMYSKLRRYLFSIQLSGVIVLYSRDILQTARDITEAYHWFQKRWADHTALLQVQKLAIPTLEGTPSLVREWAARLPGVGVKHSMEAERMFRTPIKLARADERDWLKLAGIGVPSAQRIVKAINGF